MVVYNEIDPYACAWMRNLIQAGAIVQGEVVEEDIKKLDPERVRNVAQFHAFAGIGVWSYALRLAGWPEEVPVWTGSCPCQPFSAAGQRKGSEDARHLWPAWFRLICECKPPVIFGEQVASRDGRAWLAAVRADLEEVGYAVGAADLCAAGVGAPHIRQRLYFVAYRCSDGRGQGTEQVRGGQPEPAGDGEAGIVVDSEGEGLQGYGVHTRSSEGDKSRGAGVSGGTVAYADPNGCSFFEEARRVHEEGAPRNDALRRSQPGELGHAHDNGAPQDPGAIPEHEGQHADGPPGRGDAPVRPGTDGFWSDCVWLPCTDGKARPVEPGSFPLVDGLDPDMGSDRPGEASPFRVIRDPKTGRSLGQAPWRIGMLRGYGNAIVPQAAASFIRAAMFTSTLKG